MTPPQQAKHETTTTAPTPSVQRLWTRPGVLACAVAVVVAYGSLIPFDFQWSSSVEQQGGVGNAIVNTLTSPAWRATEQGSSSLGVPFSVSDLLVNLLLYLPLGAAIRMALRPRWRNWSIQVLGAAALGFALSWSVESLQGLMPIRVASLNDVVCNTGGALLGALLALRLWSFAKAGSFAAYCRLGGVGDRARRVLHRPGVAMGLAIANALIIGVWYLLEVRRSAEGGGVALPFERAFYLPYDIGAVLLGQGLLVYAGLGCLLLLLTYTGTRRLAMNWVVLGVVLVAFAAELSRAVTHNAAPDVTGPLLALTAASAMTVTVYTFSLAVKRMNRRHEAQSYEGPERRRRPHEYI